MLKITTISVKCPYCEHNNAIKTEYLSNDLYDLITCDLEDGGCDKTFMAYIKPMCSTKSFKVEGQTNERVFS